MPGFPAAIPALVNDLDLEVVGPAGELYRGNAFLDGESVSGTPAADNLNNVECVYLSEPPPGEYVVRVRARNVPEDARIDTPAIDQDFALVISGAFPPAGTGVLALDRSVYTAPGQMGVRLFDSDLAGTGAATVLVRSTTETNAESLTLHPFGSSGTFTGAIATATGPVCPRRAIADQAWRHHRGQVFRRLVCCVAYRYGNRRLGAPGHHECPSHKRIRRGGCDLAHR